MTPTTKETLLRRFFSRFFGTQKLDADLSAPPPLTDPLSDTGLDSVMMESVLAQIDVDIAMTSHENWKLRFKKTLDGRSGEVFDPTIVGLDNYSELGQWLHGPGQEQLGHYPEFQVLIARHKYFHMQAELVATQANSGDIDKALHTFHSSYRQASSQIILLLQQLKRNLERPD